jgi:hypothetical protein
MSSVPQQQQHLTSADMNMIIRVHAGACTRNAISAGSLDAKRLAAPLVSEFQHGVSEEPGLLAAFTADGALNPSIPVSRMAKFIGNALSEWEA